MIGEHYIKSWSSTQKNITLSSGEAELVAAVKTSTETMGVMQMAEEWDIHLRGSILVDSAAALGVVKRRGNGKLRHIKVGMLWIQEKAEEGELKYKKVAGTDNPADLLTKYLAQRNIDDGMVRTSSACLEGRAESSLTSM